MAKKTGKNKGGRPSKYKDEYADQARKLCLLGATDVELADFFGVCEKTINNWKEDVPEFLQSLKEGKVIADAEVAEKLYERATGFTWTEKQVVKQKTGKDQEDIKVIDVEKTVPPDTQAASIWLYNRQPRKWRKHPFDDGGDDPVLPVQINIEVVDASVKTDADA